MVSISVCCAVDTGLPASEVLSTLPNPTSPLVVDCALNEAYVPLCEKAATSEMSDEPIAKNDFIFAAEPLDTVSASNFVFTNESV